MSLNVPNYLEIYLDHHELLQQIPPFTHTKLRKRKVRNLKVMSIKGIVIHAKNKLYLELTFIQYNVHCSKLGTDCGNEEIVKKLTPLGILG